MTKRRFNTWLNVYLLETRPNECLTNICPNEGNKRGRTHTWLKEGISNRQYSIYCKPMQITICNSSLLPVGKHVTKENAITGMYICTVLYIVHCFQSLWGMTAKWLKGTVQRDFRPLFFASFEPTWATDQWVKIFLNLVSLSPRYSKFSIKNTDSPPQYHTAQSQSRKPRIPRRNLYKNRKYFNPVLSGQGRLEL